MKGRLQYQFTRPDAHTLRLDAWDGTAHVLRRAEVATVGKTPTVLANAFHAAAQRNLLLSRAADVGADWPNDARTDVTLWLRFRDIIAQMPRGPT